jgi:hypothetical protein
MKARSLILFVGVAIVSGGLCFAFGHLLGSWQEASSGDGRPVATILPAGGGVSEPESKGVHSIPPANFNDASGMSAYEAKLEKLGLGENLSKWLAISAKARADLPGSLALARQSHLLREWAAAVALSNPKEGFPFVHSVHELSIDLYSGETALGAFFQTLGAAHPEVGRPLLDQLGIYEAMYNAEPNFYSSWAKVDPDAALESALQTRSRALREQALLGVLHTWGARDPHGMMEWASGQGHEIGKMAGRAVSDPDEQGDPIAVLNLAREFPQMAKNIDLVNTAGNLVGRGAAGWKAIEEFPAGSARNEMIEWFSDRLAETDPKAAWDLAKSLSPQDRKQFIGAFAPRELAKVAPAEVAKIMLDPDFPALVNVSEVVSTWAGKDPKAAFQWSTENLTGMQLSDSVQAALGQWAKTDPAAAVAAADGMPRGLRAQLLPGMLSDWAQADPQAAVSFATQLPPIDQQRAIEGAIRGWAETDPKAAAEGLLKLPYSFKDAYDDVASQLQEKDPVFAMSWAARIPDSASAASEAESIEESWGGRDAEAASDQLATLQPGDFRDKAVAGFVDSISNLDPKSAAGWATSIQQPKLRENTLRNVVKSWHASDPASASAFIDAMPAGDLRDKMTAIIQK